MEITKVKGIVISENAYSETSKLLNIFTEEYGIISVIAKGAKSIKSPIRSVTTKLTYAIFQIYYKKGKLSTLVCADVINPFTEIKKDLLKISYASFLLELTSQVLKQTNEKDIFELLEETLLKIEDGYDPIIITNILLIISSLLILMFTPNNRYWGLYIIIFVIFCDFGFYKTFKDETEKIMQYFNENVFIES